MLGKNTRNKFIVHSLDPEQIWEDSEAITRFYYLRDIIKGTEDDFDFMLEFTERQQLRQMILEDIYISYFFRKLI